METTTRLWLSAFAAMAVLLLGWLVAGFVAWDFDPGRWTVDGRAFAGLLAITAAAFAALVVWWGTEDV